MHQQFRLGSLALSLSRCPRRVESWAERGGLNTDAPPSGTSAGLHCVRAASPPLRRLLGAKGNSSKQEQKHKYERAFPLWPSERVVSERVRWWW